MTGLLDALSWLSILMSSTCVLFVFFLLFDGAKEEAA